MAYPRTRNKIPPLRFDWSFWLIVIITGVWLGYNYLKADSGKNQIDSIDPEPSQVKAKNSLSEFENMPGIGYPRPVEGEQIVRHTAFTLSYNEEAEQPSWVAYKLSADNFKGAFTRNEVRTRFQEDLDVSSGSATSFDYKKSGFDKGHLAPAGDMKFNMHTYSESFFMSNMSPQNHDFNTGLWNRMEEKVRKWQKRDKILYVVTGPILKKGLFTIGSNKVAVPEMFYKVLLDISEPQVKMLAFLVPNEDSDLSMEKFVVSVDKVELETGLDFFYQLPDTLEMKLEEKSDARTWFSK